MTVPLRLAPAWAFWVFLGGLAVLTPDLLRPAGWSFLDGVDLIFHEAGHVLFSPFGPTLMLLGGSLFFSSDFGKGSTFTLALKTKQQQHH